MPTASNYYYSQPQIGGKGKSQESLGESPFSLTVNEWGSGRRNPNGNVFDHFPLVLLFQVVDAKLLLLLDERELPKMGIAGDMG